jgi:hypothetical protein
MATYGTAVYNGTTYTLYGYPGSTIIDEFNRLANGGSYPSYQNYLDIQGAVNKWTGAPVGTGIIASLNYKYSVTRPPKDYREMNAVLAELSNVGTIGSPSTYVEAVTALRTIAS